MKLGLETRISHKVAVGDLFVVIPVAATRCWCLVERRWTMLFVLGVEHCLEKELDLLAVAAVGLEAAGLP